MHFRSVLQNWNAFNPKEITVDGDAVTTPKNVIALIGTQIFDIISFVEDIKVPKIIMGGPMMGRAIYHDGNSH